MTQETQHLEFLISQYVDDVLDAPNRKFVEQQLSADPAARELLKQHREAQDLLDDYGSRIPMINWAEFDATLTARLDAETAAPVGVVGWRKWMRPVAAAAALLIAASLGYGWHAYNSANQQSIAKVNPPVVVPGAVQPVSTVTIADKPSPAGSAGHAVIDEAVTQKANHQDVAVERSAPTGPIGSPPAGGVTSSTPATQMGETANPLN